MASITETQHREEAGRIADKAIDDRVCCSEFPRCQTAAWRIALAETIAQALATSHQSGRDEGLEEAAKVAEAEGIVPLDDLRKVHREEALRILAREVRAKEIATAIRSLKTEGPR